jgi:hypothetical protein
VNLAEFVGRFPNGRWDSENVYAVPCLSHPKSAALFTVGHGRINGKDPACGCTVNQVLAASNGERPENSANGAARRNSPKAPPAAAPSDAPESSEPVAESGAQQRSNQMRAALTADRAEILRAVKLIAQPAGVHEVRALNVKDAGPTASGYFNSPKPLVEAVLRLDAEGIYITANPTDQKLLARSKNRVKSFAKHTTSDTDILSRRGLLFDIDSVRPSGISSTEEEHEAALARAKEVQAFLTERGWPLPILADSGNGSHLLYRIAEPNDASTATLCKRVLEALDSLFSDDAVMVDRTTYNASRIIRLYGTVARKGDSTPDRPHRLSRILAAPAELGVVTREQLEQIAALLPEPERRANTYQSRDQFDLENFIAQHGIPIKRHSTWSGGERWVLERCVFDPNHTGSSAAILRMTSGALVYRCFHNSCAGREWKDLREIYEPEATRRRAHRDYEPRKNKPQAPGDGENHHHADDDDDIGAEGQQQQEAEWPEPIPLDMPLLPTVPTDTFPPAIGDMIDETAAATETPRELAFGMALGTLAAACQRKIEVCVKPGYTEPLSLWPIAPLNSGERKTAVLQRMTRPLTEWEREQASNMKAEIAKAMSERETALAQIQAMRTRAARLDPGSADFAEASEAIANLEVNLKEVPRAPRVWAQDVTPEKLGVLIADHGEQMTIISDEGGIVDIMAGLYSRGIPNIDVFLKGHSASPVRVDRGSRPAVLIQRPALTMVLSPQPEVLRGLAADRRFRGRGLLARFVYLLGSSTLGRRTGKFSPTPRSASSAYEACIQRLLAIKPPPERGALTIELSDDARTEWHAYFVEVEKDLRPDGRFEYMRDWAGKLPGMAARVAGLLHCAEHAFDDDPTASKLSLNTMKRALDFAAVCERHALAAYDLMGADLALEAARRLWGWVERQRKVEFTFRSAFKALQGSYPRAADLEPAFAVLLERAYIANKQTAPRIGRPTRVYQVNPALTERWAKEGAQWTGERRAI